MMRSHLGSLLFVFGLGGVFVPNLAQAAPVSQKTPAAERGSVTVNTVATEIEIVGTDRKEVAVSGDLPAGYELTVKKRSNGIDVAVQPPRGRSKGQGHLRIEVPRSSELNVKSVSGDLSSSDLVNDVSLETVSGNIKSAGSPQELTATSVSGNIVVRGGKKRTRARTVSGTVKVEAPAGQLEVGGVSGDVEVKSAAVTRCKVQAISGSIVLEGSLTGSGPHELTVHSGRVTLRLPRSAAVEIDAASHVGTVHNEIGGTQSRGKAIISVGKGGPTVRVRTFSGDIRVEHERG